MAGGRCDLRSAGSFARAGVCLFTSYQQMRQVYEMLKIRLDHPMMMQGEAPRTALIENVSQYSGRSAIWHI